jgi:hypothetical protein
MTRMRRTDTLIALTAIKRRTVRAIAVGAALVVGCVTTANGADSAPVVDEWDVAGHAVRLVGSATVPNDQTVDGVPVGGLSGIDRDATGQYVLVSDDDRATPRLARIHTARITLDRPENAAAASVGVQITGTRPLLRPDGRPFAPPALTSADAATSAVDPEGIRVDPHTGDYWWCQEGARFLDASLPATLVAPSIQAAHPDGSFVGKIPLPGNQYFSFDQHGPRHNETLEGLTFARNGTAVVSVLESPLFQDGPQPSTTRGGLVRVTVQTRDGHTEAQYAYPVEPLFAAPTPPTGAASTGVPDILATNPGADSRYLVLERTFVAGAGNKIRIFEANTSRATNITDVDSLATTPVQPVRKRLLVDLNQLGLPHIDNIEAMAWGPTLPTGERTLILVSDNNFSSRQITQVIALAIR